MFTLSLATRTTLKDLLHLAWPVVLARIGIMTMGLTDAIVVGNWSGEQLAFHALAWAPTAILVTTAVGLMMGVQVMTARMLGEGRTHEVGAVFRRGVVYALQIGVVSMVGLILLGPWALRHAGLADGLAEGASRPLVIFALSMPAYLVSVAAQFFLEALHRPKAGMWAMWVANGVNLALNLLLVPDLLGIGWSGASPACRWRCSSSGSSSACPRRGRWACSTGRVGTGSWSVSSARSATGRAAPTSSRWRPSGR